MKWENRDTNVPNVPKFSKLGDIVIPLRFIEFFFDDVLVIWLLANQVAQS